MAKMPTRMQARAHQDVAEEEDQTMNLPMKARWRRRWSRAGAQILPEGERGHHLGGGLAHERGDGDDGVAVGAQRVNEHGQRGHGGGAVAAAVVQQDDGAAELRLGLHVSNCSRTDWVISAGDLRDARSSRWCRSCCR
jgi:hypothetical protein